MDIERMYVYIIGREITHGLERQKPEMPYYRLYLYIQLMRDY